MSADTGVALLPSPSPLVPGRIRPHIVIYGSSSAPPAYRGTGAVIEAAAKRAELALAAALQAAGWRV